MTVREGGIDTIARLEMSECLDSSWAFSVVKLLGNDGDEGQGQQS